MNKHTAGTWRAVGKGTGSKVAGEDGRIMVLHPDGQRIIACCSTGYSSKETISEEERAANAKLIAAAPELLNALINLMPLVDREDVSDEWFQEFRAAQEAINKATGFQSPVSDQ